MAVNKMGIPSLQLTKKANRINSTCLLHGDRVNEEIAQQREQEGLCWA
jgi:hypothetical protein